MSLAPGVRFGSCEVVALIGAGGMGEVYRARDTKLNRDVALKVLPEVAAIDGDRSSRFAREAQVLASLNHPNIAAIYGLEESNGVHALVLELVEGPTLADLLAHGPIPIEDTLRIAKQIAEALEAAHAVGIIHRDLKPANIKVRADGTVKVLDFGLAKALEPASAPGASAGQALSQSPTITSPAMTAAGMILGTAAYMSPEQARGHTADRRADIWAFGVVVFEMLTGRRLFAGETISDTLASVLKTDPDWRELPPMSARLRRLLRSCLVKDPKRRLQDIGDARVQIEDVLAGAPDEVDAVPGSGIASTSRRPLAWAVTVMLAAALVATLLLWAPWRRTSSQPALRMSALIGPDVSLVFGAGSSIAISPDGTTIAYIAQKDSGNVPQVYVRRLAQLENTAAPLAGTENPETVFFSPDSRSIGFFADGQLKTVAVSGGVTSSLARASVQRGAAWGEDGTIAFVPERTGGLMRVPASGGTPEPLTSLAEGEATHRWPQLLPGGKAVLFTSSAVPNAAWNDGSIVVQMLDGGTRKVVERGYYGHYVNSGHLLFMRSGTLHAMPFDLDRLEKTGPAMAVVDGVMSTTDSGSAQFTVSADGALVFVPGPNVGGGIPIHWFDAQGAANPLRATRSNWLNIRFAPDSRRLALQITQLQDDIWIYSLAQDTLTPLTTEPDADSTPVWTPDSSRIVFASTRGDKVTPNLYWQRADETTGADRLTSSKNPQQPGSWHPNGRFLAFQEASPATRSDLMILEMEGDATSGWKPGKVTAFLNTPFEEREPIFSPDGRWIAYVSNESGRDEVYVRPFPGPGGRVVISNNGGRTPTWSPTPTKNELFYCVGVGRQQLQIMVTRYTVEGGSLRTEMPRLWSDQRLESRGPNRMYDVHPDGTRFVAAPLSDLQSLVGRDHLTFMFDLFDELRRLEAR